MCLGRRFGYKGGKLVGNQKKIDVAAPFGTINEKDFAKLRTKGKRMQAREGTLPLTKRNIKEGKPGKIKELPFGNMSEEKRKLKSQRKP